MYIYSILWEKNLSRRWKVWCRQLHFVIHFMERGPI